MGFNKGIQGIQLARQIADDVVLRQALRGAVFGLLVHGNVLWIFQTEASKILYRSSLRCRKQHRLALLWQIFDNGVHRLLETHIHTSISLVQNFAKNQVLDQVAA